MLRGIIAGLTLILAVIFLNYISFGSDMASFRQILGGTGLICPQAERKKATRMVKGKSQ